MHLRQLAAVTTLVAALVTGASGQLTTGAPHTGNDWPIRLKNTLKGTWSNPWTPVWIDNHTAYAITVNNILLPPNVAISTPHGQNNCTNLGPVTIQPGGSCLLYVSYFASRTGHIPLGPIVLVGPTVNGVATAPLDVLTTGYGCPDTWTSAECDEFNAGW